MKILKMIFFFYVFAGMSSSVYANDVREAVVKIFVNSNSMDYYRPWQSRGTQSAAGSGCVISGNQILTNAHVVADQTFIQVRRESDPKKYTAQVKAMGDDCDLALLTVDDPDFFSGVKPLELGELPELQDSVTVIGFPQGGDKISITEGVVSRVEIIPYVQSSKRLLAIQIDAAINPGNSGGPVMQKGKMVGVAMQAMTSSQNIGYMIPTTVIRHFLADLQDGNYDGFPILGIEYVGTENAALREYFQIHDAVGGVLVNYVLPFTPAEDVLLPRDVILKVDGVALGLDGTYEFRKGERLNFSQVIQEKQIGEKSTVEFIRAGKKGSVTVDFKSSVGLVPPPNYFKKPPYFIFGGLVFTVLSSDLLQSWGKEWWQKAPPDFMNYLVGKGRLNLDKKEQIVVLLEVLPDTVNIGYHDFRNEVVSKINGQEFRSFREFVALIRAGKTKDYTIIETDQKLPIIIRNQNIEKITQEILTRNSIPAQSSLDVGEGL